MRRTIVMLVYDGSVTLDICGPLDVFGFANFSLLATGRVSEPAYELKLYAREPGPVKTASGVRILADRAYADADETIDTLLIAGSNDVNNVLADRAMVSWLIGAAPKARRVASICTGTFLLAASGLLAGRRATTHWLFCDRLARDYPDVEVEPDRIFIKDDSLYTSGGVTSGIDLALALIEEDWGREVAALTARGLVVFLRRPGGQSQFSHFLGGNAHARPDLNDLLIWIVNNPRADLSVEALAERMAMSPRNFARIFTRETGMTPARFVEQTRIEAARCQLQQSQAPVEAVAECCGFGGVEQLRRSFIRRFKVGPREYRARFHSTGSNQ